MMATPLAALRRSESKARFMLRLGLDIRNPHHRNLYNLMKADASRGRERIIATMHSQGYLPVSGCYSTSQISERVMNAEILYIYETAPPATKYLYQLAHDEDHPAEPNWIIRWMLWHVFRYRDGRQKRIDTPGGSSSDDEEDGGDDGAGGKGPNSTGPRTAIKQPVSPSKRYDPIRDNWNG